MQDEAAEKNTACIRKDIPSFDDFFQASFGQKEALFPMTV